MADIGLADIEFTDVANAIRNAVNEQGFFHHLSARIDEISAGTVVMSVGRKPELLQQHGFFHGGVISFLVDNAATCAAGTVVDRKTQTCLTAEYKLNIVSPASGDRLVCTATVVRPGRRLVVVEAKVHSHTADDTKLVAVALATIANVDRAELTR